MSDPFDAAQALEEMDREGAVEAARRPLSAHGLMTCEDCGAEIPAARRQALPSARRCVRCQTSFERGL